MSEEKATYTLTSYGPVSVTVTVPYATAEDVQSVALSMAAEKDGSETDAKNPSWVRKNLGYESMPAFMNAARRKAQMELEEQTDAMVGALVSAELAKRLEQDPDEVLLKRVRGDVALQLKVRLDQANMSLRAFIGRNGLTFDQLNAMLDEQALEMAREQAAMIAYADEKGIEVPDQSEWPALLGTDKNMLTGLLAKADREGTRWVYEMAARSAVTMKALLKEADVTKIHETAEESRAR